MFLKRQRIDLVAECLQSQSATETYTESLQKDDDEIQEMQKDDDEIQEIMDPEGMLSMYYKYRNTIKFILYWMIFSIFLTVMII